MLNPPAITPRQLKIYRLVAYSAATFSVIAVFSVCLSLPLLYTYVSNAKSSISSELAICQNAANDIWTDVQSMNFSPGNKTGRQTRQAAGSAKYEAGSTVAPAVASYPYQNGDALPPPPPHHIPPPAYPQYPQPAAPPLPSYPEGGGGGGSSCEECCVPGPQGPKGEPGVPGRPGKGGVTLLKGACGSEITC